MVNIIKTKIEFDNNLKKRIEFICNIYNVAPNINKKIKLLELEDYIKM